MAGHDRVDIIHNVTSWDRSVNAINIGIGLLSILGSAGMILPYIFVPRLRALRHRLILGLAFADLCISLNMTSLAIYLAHDRSRTSWSIEHVACQVAGQFTVTSIVATHLWAGFIAYGTFLLLVAPFSPVLRLIDRYYLPLAVLIFSISAAIAAGTFHSKGFVFFGGYCTVRPGPYNAFVVLGPRVLAFFVIIIVYTRLYFFLRRKVDPLLRQSPAGSLPSTASSSSPLPSPSSINAPASANFPQVMYSDERRFPSTFLQRLKSTLHLSKTGRDDLALELPTGPHIQPLASTKEWQSIALPNFHASPSDTQAPLTVYSSPPSEKTSTHPRECVPKIDSDCQSPSTSTGPVTNSGKSQNSEGPANLHDASRSEEVPEESLNSQLNNVAAKMMLLYPLAVSLTSQMGFELPC